LELSAMIAPVPIPDVEPPKPEPPQQQPRQGQTSARSEIATRQALVERVDESRVIPNNISTTPNAQKERPRSGVFKISPGPETDGSPGVGPRGNNDGGGNNGFSNSGTISNNDGSGEDKPPVMPKKDPEQPRRTTPVSGGVLNGQAKSLPRPPYPKPAQLMNISDSVSVQVVIDEGGNVISAKAVSGHQLLRQAAEQAARQAKFGPTLLTGQAVKVTGVIIYRFSNG
jgi:protein TonB